MRKRKPTVNRTEMLFISAPGDTYAAYIERTERHGVWWISRLSVAPEYRKLGYALMLANRALALWGKDELWVSVSAFNDQPLDDSALIKIYSRFGFEPTAAPGIMRRLPR